MSNARENFIRIILKRSEKLESNLKLVLNRFHYHFTLDILQWFFIFYLSLKSESECIRLPRKFHFSLQFHICMYFTYFSFNFDLKREFFLFFILERIFTEQITNFNEECRENYRLQDHVFTTRNVSIGFCNLLSIIAFVFHYFPLFPREERIFHFSLCIYYYFSRVFSNPQNQLNETY